MIKEAGSKLWSLIECMVRGLLQFFFRLLHKELTEETFQGIMQFVRFGIVGFTNTVISYLLYVLSLLLLRQLGIFRGIDYYIAQAIAFVLSVLWSFYWNNRLVFRLGDGESRSLWKTLVKTYISYSFTGLFLNSALLFLWVQLLHISEFLAPIINLLVSVPLNFIINKFWAYKSE